MDADDAETVESTWAWRDLFGVRSAHEEAPEYIKSRDVYVRTVYDLITGYDDAATVLTREQKVRRLGVVKQVAADLFTLVDKSKTDGLSGDGLRSPTEWGYPVRGRECLGEVRYPDHGADVQQLHHRAYFGLPRTWPTVILWLHAAAKPDVKLDSEWSTIQDADIDRAITIRTDYYRDHGCCG
ncbi:hypothetical protein [Mycobacterium intracellulare]|uniref:hypothetical protein n=1 Tax=Mycobacterium intracellulare TaxID=1767 RepID=UPI001EECF640|nr:hypothetical protein [Mycobacterium intracellulare]MEE3755297.1 hypothetical protein [Mycobacterium intracellulare]